MKNSCIRHPENNRYIQVNEWQIKFCEGSHCAALLLSFFMNWHEWKLKNDLYYFKTNNIAEVHGEGRPHNENAYLFFTTEELKEGTMGFFGKNAINEALQLLITLNALSVHKNPNPRYHFDKTKYFQFYPEVCNHWIATHYSIDSKSNENGQQPIDYYDVSKQADRISKTNRRSVETGRPSTEKGKAITNTTNHTTNKNQSTNTHDVFFETDEKTNHSGASLINSGAQMIINALVEKEMPLERFSYPDVVPTIERLIEKGATLEMFVEAHATAVRTTNNGGFGVRYLEKTVMGLLKTKRDGHSRARPVPLVNDDYDHKIYEEDLTNLYWMDELVDERK